MPVNLEVKVKVNDGQYAKARDKISGMRDEKQDILYLDQADYYYQIDEKSDDQFQVKLKLRSERSCSKGYKHEISRSDKLIYYKRELKGLKNSTYTITEIKNHDDLVKAIGHEPVEKLKISKERIVMFVENARIHFDTVSYDGNILLGKFIEIEVVRNEKLYPGSHDREIMDKLINAMEIQKCEQISGGYEDLAREDRDKV